MKETIRRDILFLVLGLASAVAAFVFVVYLPGQRTAIRIKREIAVAEQEIRDIPHRVSQLEALHAELQSQEDYLEKTKLLIPRHEDTHEVLREVANLAKNSGLTISRMEPMTVVEHESYRQIPYRLHFEGAFRGTALFLRGLEGRHRLLTIEDLSLSQRDGDHPGRVDGDLMLAVYTSRVDIMDTDEFDESSP